MVFGASLAALELLASHHDYKLIYTNKNSINAFFIRNDLLPDGVVEALPLSKTSTSVWDHNTTINHGTKGKTSYIRFVISTTFQFRHYHYHGGEYDKLMQDGGGEDERRGREQGEGESRSPNPQAPRVSVHISSVALRK